MFIAARLMSGANGFVLRCFFNMGLLAGGENGRDLALLDGFYRFEDLLNFGDATAEATLL